MFRSPAHSLGWRTSPVDHRRARVGKGPASILEHKADPRDIDSTAIHHAAFIGEGPVDLRRARRPVFIVARRRVVEIATVEAHTASVHHAALIGKGPPIWVVPLNRPPPGSRIRPVDSRALDRMSLYLAPLPHAEC